MPTFPVPPVPDLARIEGTTVDEMFQWLLVYYNGSSVPWNYVRGRKCIFAAYKGLHRLDQLLAGCAAETNDIGRTCNIELVSLAAPLAFGRKTQPFNLPRKQFPFGRDLRAGYHIPFFFVEDGIVKLYYVQPRKRSALSIDQLSMVATIHKRFLLDEEFYDQRSDVEYVDISLTPETGERELRNYSLDNLELWPKARLESRLSLIAEALERAWTSGLIVPRKRGRAPDPDMPLFD